MTTELQTHLSRRSLWRSRITYTSAQKKLILQNKPNFPNNQINITSVNTMNYEQRTTNYFMQNKPNQTQFFTPFFLPILPVLSKAEGPIHPNQTQFKTTPHILRILFKLYISRIQLDIRKTVICIELWPILCFSYSNGVNRPFFFKVFSFEVCADPFVLLCTGGGKKFNFLKFAALVGYNFLYLLEVFSIVRNDFYDSAGNQAPHEFFEIDPAQKTSFVMTFFRPGVGEIDMKAVHRVVRHKVSKELCGIGADYPNIAQAPSADTVNTIAVVFVGPFDTQKIDLRPGPGLVEQERCFAAAHFNMHRPGTSENPGKIYFAVQIFDF